MGVAYHSCAGVVLRLVVDVGQVAGSFRGIDPGILYIRMLIAPHRSVTANQLYTAGKHFAGGCDLTHIPKIRYIDSLQGRTTVKHNLYIFQTACIKGREIYLNQFTGGLEHLLHICHIARIPLFKANNTLQRVAGFKQLTGICQRSLSIVFVPQSKKVL